MAEWCLQKRTPDYKIWGSRRNQGEALDTSMRSPQPQISLESRGSLWNTTPSLRVHGWALYAADYFTIFSSWWMNYFDGLTWFLVNPICRLDIPEHLPILQLRLLPSLSTNELGILVGYLHTTTSLFLSPSCWVAWLLLRLMIDTFEYTT